MGIVLGFAQVVDAAPELHQEVAPVPLALNTAPLRVVPEACASGLGGGGFVGLCKTLST